MEVGVDGRAALKLDAPEPGHEVAGAHEDEEARAGVEKRATLRLDAPELSHEEAGAHEDEVARKEEGRGVNAEATEDPGAEGPAEPEGKPATWYLVDLRAV